MEYAQTLDRSTTMLTGRLNAMKTGSGGLLRIGEGRDWIYEVLPTAISGLLRDNPQARVQLTVALNDELRRHLDSGVIDLFFASFSDVYFGAAYRMQILVSERMHIVARRDHPIHDAGPQKLEVLADLPWVMTGDETFGRQLVRRLFGQRGVDLPRPAVETSPVQAMINILRNSRMLGFLSVSNVADYDEFSIVETEISMPLREGGAVWRSNTALLPVAESYD